MNKPTIGRIVLYRTDGRNGLSYDLPAIITVTQETHPGDYPDGSKNPLPVPSSETHVHLTVFTPGGFGTTIAKDTDTVVGENMKVTPYSAPEKSEDFKEALNMVPGSGTYVEWNVPHSEVPVPRTWSWPVIK